MAKYVQDGPLLDIIEVRTVDATLRELKRAQQEAGSIVSGLGFSSGIRHQRIREPSRNLRA